MHDYTFDPHLPADMRRCAVVTPPPAVVTVEQQRELFRQYDIEVDGTTTEDPPLKMAIRDNAKS